MIRILDDVWYGGRSAALTIVLLCLVVATLVVALVFPQQPAGLDSAAAGQWAATTAGGYRGLGPILQALGAFDVLQGVWIHLLLALLAFNLALRLAGAAQRTWRVCHGDPGRMEPPYDATTQEVTLPGSLDARAPAAQALLSQHYGRVVLGNRAPGCRFYAERRRYGLAGPLLATAGPLLLIAGLLVNERLGWRAATVALPPATSRPVSKAPGLEVSLEGADNGTFVTLTKPGGENRTARIAPARPMRWGNLWVVQRGAGPALAVAARDNQGQTLPIQLLETGGQAASAQLLFQPTQTELGFAVPARNLVFQAVSYAELPERGVKRPVFLVAAYRGDASQPLVSELVEDQADLKIEDITVELRRDQYVTLEVADLPGVPLLVLGSLITVAGLLIVVGWGFVQVWAELAPTRESVDVRVSVSAPVGAQREAARLARDMGAG